jgi:hypothetical protein
MGCGLGDAANPLLLSVRSGAAISMPGMMDTVLNLGACFPCHCSAHLFSGGEAKIGVLPNFPPMSDMCGAAEFVAFLPVLSWSKDKQVEGPSLLCW